MNGSGRTTSGADEVLVVLDSEASPEVLARIRHEYRLTQAASDRVFVVAVDPGQALPSPDTPGVRAVGGSLPDSELADLSEQEALFVAAWRRRSEGATKERAGEGLAWDARGFEPPDRPQGPLTD